MRESERKLFIRRSVLKDVIEHVDEEIQREACGLLLGIRKGQSVFIRESRRAKNLRDSQFLYEVDPLDTYRALKEAESLGLELVGIYHSHRFGEPLPSRVDIEKAVPGLVYLIVSKDKIFKAFEILGSDFKEIEVFLEI